MADRGGRGDLLQVVRGNPSPSGHFKWPTPTVGDSKSARNSTAGRSDPDAQHHSGDTLTDFVTKWPTPRSRDWKGPGYPDDLPTAVRMWPTPKASPSGPDFARMNRQGSGGDDLATSVAREAPGQLNPTWVEWLMNFPLNWTEVE